MWSVTVVVSGNDKYTLGLFVFGFRNSGPLIPVNNTDR